VRKARISTSLIVTRDDQDLELVIDGVPLRGDAATGWPDSFEDIRAWRADDCARVILTEEEMTQAEIALLDLPT
jgi:hypothetical protein